MTIDADTISDRSGDEVQMGGSPSIDASKAQWLDLELIRIAQGRELYDATEIEPLIREARSLGMTLHKRTLSSQIRELRNAANAAERADADPKAYDAFIAKMNEDYFVLTGSDTVHVGSWKEDPSGHRTLVRRTERDFKLLLKNRPTVLVPESGDELPAAEAWLRDPNRREVRGFVFEADPAKAAELQAKKMENLFEGFAVSPDVGDISPFVRHLKEVIVALEDPGRQDDLVDYILDCLAHLVQRPGVPLQVALVFRGSQGAGKSFLTETIASLFCGNVFQTSRADDIVGRFTGHLLNVCLVVGDEALFAGSKKEADAMKHLITQPTMRIEGKHKDVVNEINRLSFILTSNHQHAVRIEPGDRRFAVFDVSDARTPRLKHREYWDALWGWAKSQEGKAALLAHLLERDLSGFDAQRDRPQTRARLDQILASLDDVHRWFFEELVEGSSLPYKLSSPLKHDKLSEETLEELADRDLKAFPKATLYEVYLEWEQKKSPKRMPRDTRTFWKVMREILGDEHVTKRRLKNVESPVPIVLLPNARERASLFAAAIGCEDLGSDQFDVPEDQGEQVMPRMQNLALVVPALGKPCA
jgi:hypothetical protein